LSALPGIDLTTAAGQALAGMVSVFAQFERQLIIERARSGMNHAEKHGTRSGKAIGRPATVAQRTTEIRSLVQLGFSMSEIARELAPPRTEREQITLDVLAKQEAKRKPHEPRTP